MSLNTFIIRLRIGIEHSTITGTNANTISAGLLLGFYVLKAALNFVLQYWGHIVGVRIQADMRAELFQTVVKKQPARKQYGEIEKVHTEIHCGKELTHHLVLSAFGFDEVFVGYARGAV